MGAGGQEWLGHPPAGPEAAAQLEMWLCQSTPCYSRNTDLPAQEGCTVSVVQ